MDTTFTPCLCICSRQIVLWKFWFPVYDGFIGSMQIFNRINVNMQCDFKKGKKNTVLINKRGSMFLHYRGITVFAMR